MKLSTSRVSAEEELTFLLNEGYNILGWLHSDFLEKCEQQTFDPTSDIDRYRTAIDKWASDVISALKRIFPTALESNMFRFPKQQSGVYSGYNDKWMWLENRLRNYILILIEIKDYKINTYTDLPVSNQIFIEDIDSFRKARDINPSIIKTLLENDRLDILEDDIQLALEQILDVSFHKNDWGGEKNDLYTANVIVNGRRIQTAFLLKGKGLRSRILEIAGCGKNGDQLVHLINSPAELFIVQFVGVISESVIKDIDGKVNELRLRGKPAWFCVIDGQDTARLLRAYGKI